MSTGTLIAYACGALAGVFVLGAGFVWFRKRQQSKKAADQSADGPAKDQQQSDDESVYSEDEKPRKRRGKTREEEPPMTPESAYDPHARADRASRPQKTGRSSRPQPTVESGSDSDISLRSPVRGTPPPAYKGRKGSAGPRKGGRF